jgi:hypothetical protein
MYTLELKSCSPFPSPHVVDGVCCVDSRVPIEVVTLVGVGGTRRLAAATISIQISGAVEKLDCALNNKTAGTVAVAVAIAVVACEVCSTERMAKAVLAAKQQAVVGISETGWRTSILRYVSPSEPLLEKMTQRAWVGTEDDETEDDRLKAVVRILWKIEDECL